MGQQVVVIGLGRFGSSLARELSRAGHEVLGVDIDMAVVQRMSSELAHVVQVNVMDETALASLGIANFDAAVVGISEHVESSILTTLMLKRLGVPRVVAKAAGELHGEILQRVGADLVVYPERDTGIRLAHAWVSTDITDVLDVVEGYGVSRVQIPPGMVGLTVGEVKQGAPRSLSVFLLARGHHVIAFPTADERLGAGDILVVAGQTPDLADFLARFHPA